MRECTPEHGVRSHEESAVVAFPDCFQALREKYFDPLQRLFGLETERSTQATSPGFASVSAAAGWVRVHFESDRGICSFLGGFADEERDLCSVETFAERFPRVRVAPGGHQRLSLDEQASFLRDHWGDLQVMFSPAHAHETRAWHAAQARAHMRKITRDP